MERDDDDAMEVDADLEPQYNWGFTISKKSHGYLAYADLAAQQNFDFAENSAKCLFLDSITQPEWKDALHYMSRSEFAIERLNEARKWKFDSITFKGVVDGRFFEYIRASNLLHKLARFKFMQLFMCKFENFTTLRFEYFLEFLGAIGPKSLYVADPHDGLTVSSESYDFLRHLFREKHPGLEEFRLDYVMADLPTTATVVLLDVIQACTNLKSFQINSLIPENRSKGKVVYSKFALRQNCAAILDNLLQNASLARLRLPAWFFEEASVLNKIASIPDLLKSRNCTIEHLTVFWSANDHSKLDFSQQAMSFSPIRVLVLKGNTLPELVSSAAFQNGNALPSAIRYSLRSLQYFNTQMSLDLLNMYVSPGAVPGKISVVEIFRRKNLKSKKFVVTKNKVRKIVREDGQDTDSDNPPPSQYL